MSRPTEINGFEIDVYNQYGLDEEKKLGTCPKCSDDRKKNKEECCYYNWDTGIAKCNHCGESIQMHTFKRKGSPIKEYTKPNQDILEKLDVSENVIKWFDGRGITESTLRKFRIKSSTEQMPVNGEWKRRNVIQFPFYIGGELVNIQYRDREKNFKMVSGAEKVFYNIDSTIGSDYIVISEGMIDVLSIYEAGITSCVSVPNGATKTHNNLDYLDSCIDYFEDKEKIILAVDNDEAGIALRDELIRRLGAEVCFVPDLKDCKDANDYLLKYGKVALQDAIHNAKPVPLEGVVTMSDVEQDVDDFFENGFKKGYTIGLDNFDEIFSTYTKQFVVVTGIGSSGKSDFIDMMTIGYNKKYGWKTAYASPENKPNWLHAQKLVRKVYNGMPDKSTINSDDYKEAKEYINDNFFFIEMDKYDIDSVLTKGAELVKRKGIKCLCIDPWNKVRDKSKSASSDINEYTINYLEKIEVFAKKHDCFVILVAHPVKMRKGDDGEFIEPTMYDIKGGGEIYDASYHGLLVHRNYSKGYTKVKVLKVKFQNLGENQAECYFTWDRNSGNFIPLNINNPSSPQYRAINDSDAREKFPWMFPSN